MNIIHLSKAFAAALFGFIAFPDHAKADIAVAAKVTSSSATTTTVQFIFSGSIPASATAAPNLHEYLFIDLTPSTGINAGLPTSSSADYQTFDKNTVAADSGATIFKIEVRNNEQPAYMPRLGFAFTQQLSQGSSIAANSVIEVTFPTTIPLLTSDFNNLNVYWGFPTFGTNSGRGTLVGLVNPVSATPTIGIALNATGQSIVTFTGTLESSPDLSTPFTAVTGAVSPYTVPAASPAKLFYRASITQ